MTIRQRIGIFMPILQAVIGDDFPGVMAAAQQGSEAAFSVLWRDGNPDLLRYLRVAAPEATDDVASETWVQVCRGLRGFRGDEQAWRSWLFTIARRRAIDEGRRRSRHPVAPLADLPQAREPRAPDAEMQALENLATAGVITAILALPPCRRKSSCCGCWAAWTTRRWPGSWAAALARSGSPPTGDCAGWPSPCLRRV